MSIHANLRFIAAFGLGIALFTSGPAFSQTQSTPKKQYEGLIYSVRGPDLYRAHCAVCHGLQGKGDGPVGATLRTRPADLTVLAKNNGGNFPAQRIQKFIADIDPSVQSHGSREMPVWGPIFHRVEEDQDFGNVRLQNLIKYLETIQQK